MNRTIGCIGFALFVLVGHVSAQITVEETNSSLYSTSVFQETPTHTLLWSEQGVEQHLSRSMQVEGRHLRQSLLLSALTLTTVGYGIFTVRFNKARGTSEKAADAYRQDILANGQNYVDSGIPLDQVDSYLAWDKAFRDAVVEREWAARMGVLAAVTVLFTLLDSATTGNETQPSSAYQPRLYLGTLQGEPAVQIGARISLP